MIGFFSLSNDDKCVIQKDNIYFVSIPDDLPSEEIKSRYAHIAQLFANQLDSNRVFLNYGKDEFIEYDYSI